MTLLDARPGQTRAGGEAPGVWVFTFGAGHRLMIASAHDGQVRGAGVSLGRRYVLITGTRESAREEFTEMFGASFCDQYDEFRGLQVIAAYGLTELVIEAG